ncbi:MAG: AraC family transcriptional regulator [Clostridia bacterium]|nr:AraC family transcriptional regulator [Clostridia bacterium]
MIIKQIAYQTLVPKESFRYDRPHGIDEYVLVLAHTPAYFCADGIRFLLRPHQLFIYNKLQPQLFYSGDTDFLQDWFHFDMTEEEAAGFGALGIPFGRPIPISNTYLLSEYIRLLAIEHSQAAAHRSEIVSDLLRCFFMRLSDLIHAPEDEKTRHPYYHILNPIRAGLMSFPYRNWSAEQLAQSLHMSKSWFQHNYREIFGIPFQRDLIEIRILYAKKLLAQSNDSIEQIAQQCGYNNDVHFMRQYKKETGLTPNEYRMQNR